MQMIEVHPLDIHVFSNFAPRELCLYCVCLARFWWTYGGTSTIQSNRHLKNSRGRPMMATWLEPIQEFRERDVSGEQGQRDDFSRVVDP